MREGNVVNYYTPFFNWSMVFFISSNLYLLSSFLISSTSSASNILLSELIFIDSKWIGWFGFGMQYRQFYQF